MRIKVYLLVLCIPFLLCCNRKTTHSVGEVAPKIVFNNLEYDFGTLSSRNEPVHYDFKFKNSGQSILVIHSVESSCGCLDVQKPAKPIKPGKNASISLTFHPNATQYGYVKRYVDVYNNSSNLPLVHLTICGVVEP